MPNVRARGNISTFTMYDPRILEVEIHEGNSAMHAVVTAQSPGGNGFLIIHATFENTVRQKEVNAYARYRLINPVVEKAWEKCQRSRTGYGEFWSYYLADRIEHWKSGAETEGANGQAKV